MLLKDPAGNLGRPFFIYAGRSAGKNHSPRVQVFDRVPATFGLGYHGVDLQLTDTAGDEVAVLGAKIDNDDAFVNRLLAVFVFRSYTV